MKKKQRIKQLEERVESLSRSLTALKLKEETKHIINKQPIEITKEFITQEDVVFKCDTVEEVDWFEKTCNSFGFNYYKKAMYKAALDKGYCFKVEKNNNNHLLFAYDINEEEIEIIRVADLMNGTYHSVEADEMVEETSKPQIGDLCLFWDEDGGRRRLSMLESFDLNVKYPYCSAGDDNMCDDNMWKYCKKVTIEEAREYFGIKR